MTTIGITGALLHPAEPRILALLRDGTLQLPRFEIAIQTEVQNDNWPRFEIDRFPLEPHVVGGLIERRLGAKAQTLRVISQREDIVTGTVSLCFLLENLDPDWKPTATDRWIGIGELSTLNLLSPSDRIAIEQVLSEIENSTFPVQQQPWGRAGWQAHAEAWIRDQIAQFGYRATSPIEEVRKWPISCVLRVPTDRGRLYFKASGGSNFFAREAAVTKGLASIFPGQVPTPLSTHLLENWMLLADFAEEDRKTVPVNRCGTMLVAFGQLQRQALSRMQELQAIGIPSFGLERLAKAVDDLANFCVETTCLSSQKQIHFRMLAPRLKSMCEALASYRVPPTLTHGDLHVGNVALKTTEREVSFVFFDWADTCLSHPFLDLGVLGSAVDAAERVQIGNAYLSLWTDFEPIDRLREMLDLALALFPLHQAIGYRHLIPQLTDSGTRANSDWVAALSFWVEKLLRLEEN